MDWKIRQLLCCRCGLAWLVVLGQGLGFELTCKRRPPQALEEMTERDWRIFREDFSIAYKGVSSGINALPIRNWEEAKLPEPVLQVRSLAHSCFGRSCLARVCVMALKRPHSDERCLKRKRRLPNKHIRGGQAAAARSADLLAHCLRARAATGSCRAGAAAVSGMPLYL